MQNLDMMIYKHAEASGRCVFVKRVRFSSGGRVAAWVVLLAVFLFPACKNTPTPVVDPIDPRVPQPPDYNQTGTQFFGSNYTVQYVDPGFESPIDSPTQIADFGLLLDQIKVNFPARVKSQFNIRTVIDRAQSSVDLAMPEINDQETVDALVRAVLRGVAVRVVTEHFYRISDGSPLFNVNGVPHFDKPFYDQLEANGVTLVDDGDNLSRQMHSRYMVVDGNQVLFATGTLTARTFFYSNTLIVTLNSPLVASYFERDFNDMIGGKFGAAKPVGNSQVTGIHIGDAVLDIYFGPANGLLKTIVADDVFGRAQNAAVFANYDFTDSFLGDRINTLINSGVFVSGVWDGVQAVAEGQGSQYFRPSFVPLMYEDHTTAFGALNALAGSGFAADFGDQPPFQIRFMNLKYVATDPQSVTLDPEVAIMTNTWTQTAFNLNDEILLVFHDRNLSGFFFNRIHFRVLMAAATTEVDQQTGVMSITETPLARVFGQFDVHRAGVPAPFTDNKPASSDIGGFYRSLGVANLDGDLGSPDTNGRLGSFLPIGGDAVCFSVGQSGGGGTQGGFETCITGGGTTGGGGGSSQISYFPTGAGPKILLPGTIWNLGTLRFKPTDPFAGGGVGGGGG